MSIIWRLTAASTTIPRSVSAGAAPSITESPTARNGTGSVGSGSVVVVLVVVVVCAAGAEPVAAGAVVAVDGAVVAVPVSTGVVGLAIAPRSTTTSSPKSVDSAISFCFRSARARLNTPKIDSARHDPNTTVTS